MARRLRAALVLAVLVAAALAASGSAPGGPGNPWLVTAHVAPPAATTDHKAPRQDLSEVLRRRGTLVPDEAALQRGKARAELHGLPALPSRAEATPLDPVRSWQGVDDAEAPPDTTGAIGPTRYVELVNTRFGIYDRTHDEPLATGDLADLAPAVKPPDHGGVLTDPHVIWDAGTDRFYYAYSDWDYNDQVNSSYIVYGFSKTASPNGPADFCTYYLDFGYEPIVDDEIEDDALFPEGLKLGDTQDFVLLAGTMFDWYWFDDFGARIHWIAKPPAGPDCPPASSFTAGTAQSFGPDFFRLDAVIPANQIDPSPTGWAVAAFDYSYGMSASKQVWLLRITKGDDGKAIVQRQATALPVPPYRIPANAVQPGTTKRIWTGDARLTSAVLANDPSRGNAPALWTEHTISGGAGAAVRWYEIDPEGAGFFRTGAAASPSLFAYNAAISPDRVVNGATTAFGSNMALQFNTSSAATNPAIRFISQRGDRAQSRFTLLHSSPDPAGLCFQFCLWGDYAGATPDPAADTSAATGRVWLTNTWASRTGLNWRTQNIAVDIPESPTDAPRIDSFQPAGGLPGATVTITGTNLADVTYVEFGAGSAPVDSATATTVTVKVPPDASTWPLAVATDDGARGTSAGTFTVLRPPPVVSGFPPWVFGGDTVGVDGEHLLEDGLQAFLGSRQLDVFPNQSSPTQLFVKIPVDAVSDRITVTTVGGSSTSADVLEVRTPVRIPPHAGHAFAGAPIAIEIALQPIPLLTRVAFTGYDGGPPSIQPGTFTTFPFEFRVDTTVPRDAVSGPVAVTMDGLVATSDSSFVVDPKVKTISPASGSGGTVLTLTGSGLDATSVATFTGGATALPVAGSTANALQVVVPPGARPGKITVSTFASGVQAKSPFFAMRPHIDSFSPQTVQAGDVVSVTGSALTGPGSVLRLGSLGIAPDAGGSPGHVTFHVPAAAVTGRLTAAIPEAAFTTAGSLRVLPAIDSVSPQSGVTGQTLTITGGGLTGVTAVRFAGNAGPASVAAPFATSHGRLRVTVPQKAVSGPVAITNAGGTTTSAKSFVVDPAVRSVSRTAARVGTSVTIAGSGFDATVVASFGAVDAIRQPGSTSRELVVKVPAGATSGPIAVRTTGSSVVARTGRFRVTPAITAFGPSPAQVGDTVEVDGTTFEAPLTMRLGTHAVAAVLDSSTHLHFLVPPGAATGRLTVRTPSGSYTTPGKLVVH